tara:strand:+ start:6658 stop:7200 length:543 start_codon:yes stop_codon:yes gene_type:complete
MIKRNNDDIKADRPTLDEVKFIPRIPMYFLLENIRSAYNVGSIFRTADGMGAKKIFLSGYTCKPSQKDLSKTALGAELAIPWEHNDNPVLLANQIKKQGIQLVLLEHTKKSQSIYNLDWQFPLCVVLGNEVEGVSEELIALCDTHVEIPMRGIKQSLNVATAAGIIGYEMLRCYNRKGKN